MALNPFNAAQNQADKKKQINLEAGHMLGLNLRRNQRRCGTFSGGKSTAKSIK